MEESPEMDQVRARIAASARRFESVGDGRRTEVEAFLCELDVKFADLGERLRGVSTSSVLQERLAATDPRLAESLRADCGDEATLAVWGMSSVSQAGLDRPLVDDALLEALGEAVGASPVEGQFHAGLLHLYGYLLSSSAVDRYGPKRLRWTVGEVGLVLGGEPGWPSNADEPMLRAVTARLLGIAPLLGWTTVQDVLVPEAPAVETRLVHEFVEASASAGWTARTRLFARPLADEATDPALLVYSVRPAGQPERYISCFLVSGADVKAFKAVNPDHATARLRFNAVVPDDLSGQSDERQLPVLSQRTSGAQTAIVLTFKVDDPLGEVRELFDAAAENQPPAGEGAAVHAGSLEIDQNVLQQMVRQVGALQSLSFRRDDADPAPGRGLEIAFAVRSATLHRFEAGRSSTTVLAVEVAAPDAVAAAAAAYDADSPGPSWFPMPLYREQFLSPIANHHLLGPPEESLYRKRLRERFNAEQQEPGWDLADVIDISHLVAHRSSSSWRGLQSVAAALVSSLGLGERVCLVEGRDPSISSLTFVHAPGCDAATAEVVADAIAAGKQSSQVQESDVGTSGLSTDTVTRRSSAALYFASYSASGMVVTPETAPNGSVVPGQNYLMSGFPGQFSRDYLLVFVYALHQRLSFLDLSERLARLSMLDKSGNTSPPTDDALDGQVFEVNGIEIDVQRLLAWTRFREVSSRAGIQSFYDHVARAFRLEALEQEVDFSASGASRLLRMQLARAERESNDRLEFLLKLVGGAFAVLSLLVALFGANWNGITVKSGGMPGYGLYIALAGVLLVAVGVALWFRRGKKPPLR